MKEQYWSFIIHALDERGDPITDYNVQLFRKQWSRVQVVRFDAEVYSAIRAIDAPIWGHGVKRAFGGTAELEREPFQEGR